MVKKIILSRDNIFRWSLLFMSSTLFSLVELNITRSNGSKIKWNCFSGELWDIHWTPIVINSWIRIKRVFTKFWSILIDVIKSRLDFQSKLNGLFIDTAINWILIDIILVIDLKSDKIIWFQTTLFSLLLGRNPHFFVITHYFSRL